MLRENEATSLDLTSTRVIDIRGRIADRSAGLKCTCSFELRFRTDACRLATWKLMPVWVPQPGPLPGPQVAAGADEPAPGHLAGGALRVVAGAPAVAARALCRQ